MFFKVLDKFFDEIKHIISFVVLVLITVALVLFLYWITYAAKIALPDFLNSFVQGIIGFFEPILRLYHDYDKIKDILPVICATIIAVVVYCLNCLVVLLEDFHKKCHTTRDACRIQLEKAINTQLHNSFLDELRKNTLMLIKVKILAEKSESYLAKMSAVNTEEIASSIEKNILISVNSNLIKNKGNDKNSVYFLVMNNENTRQVLTEIVSISSRLISQNMAQNLKLQFCCVCEVFENIAEFEKINTYLNKLIELKLTNIIAGTEAVKVYYENLHPEMYNFKVLGEYNVKREQEEKNRLIMLYALQRR